VIAVSTLIPCTPLASIVFRSAWIPAPPPESDPAMVSTLGSISTPEVGVTGLGSIRRAVHGHGPGLALLVALGNRSDDGPALGHVGRLERADQRVVLATGQNELHRVLAGRGRAPPPGLPPGRTGGGH